MTHRKTFDNNGSNPIPDRQLMAIRKLLMTMAEQMDFTHHACLMLFAAVQDLHDEPGSQKKKSMERMIGAVYQLHQKSWQKREKSLLALFSQKQSLA